jgi:riboflavin kinase / FMN adenylyltransferase
LVTYFSLSEFKRLDNAVVTTGTFDGVHLGHQKILQRVSEVCQQTGGESVLLTFHPHPRIVISGTKELQLLTTIEEKIEFLEQNGVKHLLIVPFTREFSELSPDEYIQKILIETIGTKKLVIGYDHRFGRNREGSFDYLQAIKHKFGFDIEEISRKDLESVTISSTKIRTALLNGEITFANELLGRAYSIMGTVVKGKQLGRTIGFPTANIYINDTQKLIPVNGVYAVTIQHKQQTYKGMMNIGTRPTVDGSYRTIEVNIFDFDEEIYGETLKVSFVQKIRNEQKFDSLDALKNQISKDKTFIKSVLAHHQL